MSKPPPPPQSLDWLIEVLGIADTLRLIEARGGTTLWVPKGVDNSSAKLRAALEGEFGKPMVKALIRAFGGGPIKVPLCHEWRTVLYRQRGLSMAEIARKLGCHQQTVSRRLSAKRTGGRQLSFPV